MPRKNRQIEIYCPHCKVKDSLNEDLIFTDQKLICTHCKGVIYWHNCPECGTGYYDTEKKGKCPDCSSHTESAVRSELSRTPFIYKSCPYCKHKIPFISQVIFAGNVIYIHCPQCKKTSQGKGFGRWVALSFILLLIIVRLVEKNYSLDRLRQTWGNIPVILLLVTVMIIILIVTGLLLIKLDRTRES